MNVELIGYHDEMLDNIITATRTCMDSRDKADSVLEHNPFSGENHLDLGEADSKLLKKVVLAGHESVLEHMSFTFDVSDISRAMLQELARHRIASLSVQSTRYTLKKSLSAPIEDLVVTTGDKDVDKIVRETMEKITELVQARPNIGRDVIKYAIPEALLVNLVWTINARSLRNVFKLRTSKQALPEFREFCDKVWEATPEQIRFLFQDVYKVAA